MNRKDWETQLFDSNMNTTARLVALSLGTFGNWTKDKTVEPGMTKIAAMADIDRKTAKTYVEALVTQGWLRFVKTGQYNTSEYELMESTGPVTGILASKSRNMSESQLRNLSTTKVHKATQQVEEYRREHLWKRSTSKDTTVVETDAITCGNSDTSVVETGMVSCGTYPHEPSKQPSKSLVEPITTVAAAPVVEEKLSIKEEAVPFKLKNEEQGKRFLDSLILRNGISGRLRSLAKSRYWDEEYEPSVNEGVSRAGWVIAHLNII